MHVEGIHFWPTSPNLGLARLFGGVLYLSCTCRKKFIRGHFKSETRNFSGVMIEGVSSPLSDLYVEKPLYVTRMSGGVRCVVVVLVSLALIARARAKQTSISSC